ncbi:hypothetical protein D0466_20670 [Peribacillus glennii]|uniref:Uncharacterized protein n=1 Tax=Peribacillus glennii TaxID=2303991 RepID=A0A372L7C0_9BACI|nr:hypothetical protein D0466_20670 [Peribacillus glennii]
MCSDCFRHRDCHRLRTLDDDRFNRFIGRQDFITFHEDRQIRLEAERRKNGFNRRRQGCRSCRSDNFLTNQFMEIDDFLTLHENRLRGVRFQDEIIRCGGCRHFVNHIHNGNQSGLLKRNTRIL